MYDLTEEEPLIRETTLAEQEHSRTHHSDSDEYEEVSWIRKYLAVPVQHGRPSIRHYQRSVRHWLATWR